MKFLTFFIALVFYTIIISITSVDNYSLSKIGTEKKEIESISKFPGFSSIKKFSKKLYKFSKKIYKYGKSKIQSLTNLLNFGSKSKKSTIQPNKNLLPTGSKSDANKGKTKPDLNPLKISDSFLNDIGTTFCKDNCKFRKNEKMKKCLESKVNPCNFCVYKKFPKTKKTKELNKMCVDLCNRLPSSPLPCQFYPYEITVMRKKFDEKLLNNSIKN